MFIQLIHVNMSNINAHKIRIFISTSHYTINMINSNFLSVTMAGTGTPPVYRHHRRRWQRKRGAHIQLTSAPLLAATPSAKELTPTHQ